MANLKQILLTLRSGGLHHSLNILRYTLLKNRLDRDYSRNTQSSVDLSPREWIETKEVLNGFNFTFTNAALEIKFLASDLARISWEPGAAPAPYAVLQGDWPAPSLNFSTQADGWRISSQDLHLDIQPDGAICFQTPQGELLRQDLPPMLSSHGWEQLTFVQPGEQYFGMGIQAGPFDLLKRSHRFWAHDPGGNYGPNHDPLYMPVPVYLSIHDQGCYLIFFENSSDGNFHPGIHAPGKNLCEINFSSGMLRYYFFPGPPDRAIQRYTQLTGRAPLPPYWSLGYHQSRWGYKSEEDIRQVVSGFQHHNLPISAIHLDIDYMDSGRAFTFNPHQFPDIKRLANELSATGVRLVTIVDPGVKIDPDYDIYTSGMAAGVFCKQPSGEPLAGMLWLGRCLYPDFTNPAVRAWWGQFYPRLLASGVSGIWHDMNEPTSFVAWGELTLPDSTRHHLEGTGGDHRQAHNLYGLQMNRAAWESLRRCSPDQRPWILSRSGWAGGQRYAWNWTADTECTWDCLRMNLTSILGLAVSGFSYTGPDIGGFSGDPSAELFLRWFQMAAFLPFFRTHSAVGTAPREPWVYGEPYTSIIRNYLSLRYRLLPYLYTLAWQQATRGTPLIRPLFWDDWRIPALRAVDDAFLLGDALLIAPVLEEKAAQRQITLPPGQWYNFWDDTLLVADANRTYMAKTPLEQIPVFVRAGSILPMKVDSALVLHVYPPVPTAAGVHKHANPSGLLYSDLGDGYGPFRLDRFDLRQEAGYIEIVWESEGDFPFPYPNIRLQLHGASPQQAWADEREIKITAGETEVGRFNRLRLQLE